MHPALQDQTPAPDRPATVGVTGFAQRIETQSRGNDRTYRLRLGIKIGNLPEQPGVVEAVGNEAWWIRHDLLSPARQRREGAPTPYDALALAELEVPGPQAYLPENVRADLADLLVPTARIGVVEAINRP